jgi:hypothetical protein
VSKSLSVNDFRGISISPLFLKCLRTVYYVVMINILPPQTISLASKNFSCSHAIYFVREAVDLLNHSGSTIHLRAIDIRKAFDKM